MLLSLTNKINHIGDKGSSFLNVYTIRKFLVFATWKHEVTLLYNDFTIEINLVLTPDVISVCINESLFMVGIETFFIINISTTKLFSIR